MSIFRQLPSMKLLACFALLVFGGELAADVIVDAKYGCVADSSNHSGGDDDCTFCLTCGHAPGAILFESTRIQSVRPAAVQSIAIKDVQAVDGPPSRIDHPPQLA